MQASSLAQDIDNFELWHPIGQHDLVLLVKRPAKNSQNEVDYFIKRFRRRVDADRAFRNGKDQ